MSLIKGVFYILTTTAHERLDTGLGLSIVQGTCFQKKRQSPHHLAFDTHLLIAVMLFTVYQTDILVGLLFRFRILNFAHYSDLIHVIQYLSMPMPLYLIGLMGT